MEQHVPKMEQHVRVADVLDGVTLQLKNKYYAKFRGKQVDIQVCVTKN